MDELGGKPLPRPKPDPAQMTEAPFDNDGFMPEELGSNPKGIPGGRTSTNPGDGSNMLECPHDRDGFLPGEGLPDRTAEAQRGGTNGSINGINTRWGPNRYGADPGSGNPDGVDALQPWVGFPLSEDRGPDDLPATEAQLSAEDLKRGFQPLDVKRTPTYDPDVTGEGQVGDPHDYGGFAGRPRGAAR